MKVKEHMTRDLIKIDENMTLRNAIRKMEKEDVSRLLVKKDGEIIGIITERDVADRLGSWKERRISDAHIFVSNACSFDLIGVDKDDSLRHAAKSMLKTGISSLVVYDNGKIVGIVTKTDLIKSLIKSEKPVKKYMSEPVITLQLGSSLLQARKIMLRKGIKRIPIEFEEKLVGMITESDIADALGAFRKVAEGKQWDEKMKKILVDQVMSKEVITINEKSKLSEGARIMLEKDISGLPVLADSKLVGIVTKTDLIKAVAGS